MCCLSDVVVLACVVVVVVLCVFVRLFVRFA